MTESPEILVHQTDDELAEAAAARLVLRLLDVQASGEAPSVALTGGSIAVKIHEAVAAFAAGPPGPTPGEGVVDWAQVNFWFGDERYIAHDDDERNAVQARTAMLDHLPVDPARVHEMPPSDGDFGNDLEVAAAAYGQQVRAHGTGEFDVVMLGVGPDGHVASLFPGFPELDVEDTVAVAVRNSPKPPPERISLTFPALERTREVWFVVAGEQKADAVRRALDPATDFHDVPAARPRGRQRTVWFLDEAAASQL